MRPRRLSWTIRRQNHGNYSARCRRAEYCDEHVCLSVCVCPRAYLQNCTSSFHQIVCGCYLAAVWLCPFPPVCDTLCTSGFMDDGMLEHNGFFCVAYSWTNVRLEYSVCSVTHHVKAPDMRVWYLRLPGILSILVGLRGFSFTQEKESPGTRRKTIWGCLKCEGFKPETSALTQYTEI